MGTNDMTLFPDHPSHRLHIWTKTKAEAAAKSTAGEGWSWAGAEPPGGSDPGAQRPHLGMVGRKWSQWAKRKAKRPLVLLCPAGIFKLSAVPWVYLTHPG